MIKFFYLFFVFLISGCATTSYYDAAEDHYNKGNFEAAYRLYESPTKGKEKDVVVKIKSDPKLLEAGLKTFSINSLNRSISKYGKKSSFDLEYNRLELFRNYADNALYEQAMKNVKTAYPDEFSEKTLTLGT